MRRLLKFFHTCGSIGYAGGIAAYLIIAAFGPELAVSEEFVRHRESLATISRWMILPSLMLVLFSGIFAMIIHHPFLNAGWVLAKAVAGILIFEASLASIDGPARKAAKAAAEALAGTLDAGQLALMVNDRVGALWVLLALAAGNVALAIWRPRFVRSGRRTTSAPASAAAVQVQASGDHAPDQQVHGHQEA